MSVAAGTRSVLLPDGEFAMGGADFYADEAPVHRVRVDAFEIDRYPVTNAEFGEFVAATGYLTVAERPLNPADYPGVPAADLAPGALVFTPTAGPVDLRDFAQWWRWVPGARWSEPTGPGSTLGGKADHPVVQVSFTDAAAYTQWVGRTSPPKQSGNTPPAAGWTRPPTRGATSCDPTAR